MTSHAFFAHQKLIGLCLVFALKLCAFIWVFGNVLLALRYNESAPSLNLSRLTMLWKLLTMAAIYKDILLCLLILCSSVELCSCQKRPLLLCRASGSGTLQSQIFCNVFHHFLIVWRQLSCVMASSGPNIVCTVSKHRPKPALWMPMNQMSVLFITIVST